MTKTTHAKQCTCGTHCNRRRTVALLTNEAADYVATMQVDGYTVLETATHVDGFDDGHTHVTFCTVQESPRDALARELASLDGDQFQAIRRAYYTAADNLAKLAELLELADLDSCRGSNGQLLREHLQATEALDAFNQSDLGRIL